MKASDLIVGATYLLSSTDEYGRPWQGEGVYVGPESSDSYPIGTLEFNCPDGIPCMCSIKEVLYLVKDAPKPLAHWVRQLLNDLPEKRDWLDPVVEANLRELTK